MTACEQTIKEVFDILKDTCGLSEGTEESDKVFSSLREVIEKHFKDNEKKVVSKPSHKRTSVKKEKSDKISHKTAYQFYVADKMTEMKNKPEKEQIPSKDRMRQIAGCWQSEKTDKSKRAKYDEQSANYNSFIDKEVSKEGWQSRRDDIIAEAKKLVGVSDALDATSTITNLTVTQTQK